MHFRVNDDRKCIILGSISMTNNLKPNTMKTTRYTPQPIDASDVKLPIELENLVEEMIA